MLHTLTTIVEAVLGFSVLILIHEFGHFLAAKRLGFRVEAFSFGFGPYVGRKWGGTEYRLSLIPVGGYVKMGGEQREAGREPKADDFVAKPVGHRAIVFLAGPAMNVLLGFVAFIVAFQLGVDVIPAVVGSVIPGRPAWRAGILPGDKVVSLNGHGGYIDFEDLSMAAVLCDPSEGLRLGVQREGRRLDFTVRPEYSAERGIQGIGIQTPIETRIADFIEWNGHEPAQEAGLRKNDLIVAAAVESGETETRGLRPVRGPRDIGEIVRDCRGRPILLRYERGGEAGVTTGTVRVIPRHAPPDMGWTFGLTLGANVVGDVRPGSWMALAGLQKGDRIVAIGDRTNITHTSQIRTAFEKNAGRDVDVVFERPGDPTTFRAPVRVPHEPDLEAVLLFKPLNVVDDVVPGFPAENHAIRPGDRIVRIADTEVKSAEDLWSAEAKSRGRPARIEWTSDGRLLSAVFAPETPWFLGVHWTTMEENLPLGPWEACVRGTRKAVLWVRRFFGTLVGFATHRVAPRHLGGVITIGQVTYAAAQYGLAKLAYFVGILSISLGLMNLVPIPILDGGHLVFAVVESLRGRPVSERVQNAASYAGLAVILTLLLFTTWNDLWRVLGGG